MNKLEALRVAGRIDARFKCKGSTRVHIQLAPEDYELLIELRNYYPQIKNHRDLIVSLIKCEVDRINGRESDEA